jgi:hypothetical protein
MSEVRDLLISGSEEVIGRYRLPLAGAKSDRSANSIEAGSSEGSDYRTSLEAVFRKGSPRKRSTVQFLGPDRWSAGLPSAPRRSSVHRSARWLEAALRRARG